MALGFGHVVMQSGVGFTLRSVTVYWYTLLCMGTCAHAVVLSVQYTRHATTARDRARDINHCRVRLIDEVVMAWLVQL